MNEQAPNTRYIARKRRTLEDKRFVTGRGSFVQDIERPGMLHVAVLPCPYPRAQINNIEFSKALARRGVHAVLEGSELAAATNPLYCGLNTPGVKWRPLAHELSRYAGEWVAAVAADSRAIAEDAIELIEVDYTPTDPVIDPEEAYKPSSPQVHPEHGSNVLYDGQFIWGPVEDDFVAADRSLKFRARWHRSSTVPIETFGAVAEWDEGKGILNVWASIQMGYW